MKQTPSGSNTRRTFIDDACFLPAHGSTIIPFVWNYSIRTWILRRCPPSSLWRLPPCSISPFFPLACASPCTAPSSQPLRHGELLLGKGCPRAIRTSPWYILCDRFALNTTPACMKSHNRMSKEKNLPPLIAYFVLVASCRNIWNMKGNLLTICVRFSS